MFHVKQRVLQLEGGVNFRELGGYATTTGQQVKWQKILRAGSLDQLTPTDLVTLKHYGLRYDVDLRSEHEARVYPDRLPAVTQYANTPVYPFTDDHALRGLNINLPASPFAMFTQTYQQMVADSHPQQAWHQIFSDMLANTGDNESVVFHCAAGKDRTGVGAILVLAVLDVLPAVIQQDYLLTNQIFGARQHEISQIVAENESEAMTNKMNQHLSVEATNVAAVLATIKALSGSPERYLQTELGFSKQDVADLKRLYLTK